MTHKRGDELEDALRALIEALDKCAGPITNAFAFQQIHGFSYTGPMYAAELKAAREVLSSGTEKSQDDAPAK